jgi:head-tail adaptor
MLTNLRHRIIIQKENRIEFQGGAYTTSWENISTEWANCQISTDKAETRENRKFEKKQQFNIYKIKMRYIPTINNGKRILFNGKALYIDSVIDITNRGKMMTVKAREEMI